MPDGLSTPNQPLHEAAQLTMKAWVQPRSEPIARLADYFRAAPAEILFDKQRIDLQAAKTALPSATGGNASVAAAAIAQYQQAVQNAIKESTGYEISADILSCVLDQISLQSATMRLASAIQCIELESVNWLSPAQENSDAEQAVRLALLPENQLQVTMSLQKQRSLKNGQEFNTGEASFVVDLATGTIVDAACPVLTDLLNHLPPNTAQHEILGILEAPKRLLHLVTANPPTEQNVANFITLLNILAKANSLELRDYTTPEGIQLDACEIPNVLLNELRDYFTDYLAKINGEQSDILFDVFSQTSCKELYIEKFASLSPSIQTMPLDYLKGDISEAIKFVSVRESSLTDYVQFFRRAKLAGMYNTAFSFIQTYYLHKHSETFSIHPQESLEAALDLYEFATGPGRGFFPSEKTTFEHFWTPLQGDSLAPETLFQLFAELNKRLAVYPNDESNYQQLRNEVLLLDKTEVCLQKPEAKVLMGCFIRLENSFEKRSTRSCNISRNIAPQWIENLKAKINSQQTETAQAFFSGLYALFEQLELAKCNNEEIAQTLHDEINDKLKKGTRKHPSLMDKFLETPEAPKWIYTLGARFSVFRDLLFSNNSNIQTQRMCQYFDQVHRAQLQTLANNLSTKAKAPQQVHINLQKGRFTHNLGQPTQVLIAMIQDSQSFNETVKSYLINLALAVDFGDTLYVGDLLKTGLWNKRQYPSSNLIIANNSEATAQAIGIAVLILDKGIEASTDPEEPLSKLRTQFLKNRTFGYDFNKRLKTDTTAALTQSYSTLSEKLARDLLECDSLAPAPERRTAETLK